jgi:hypothetical protein
MRHHFRRPQAMFNKGSLFYSHCDLVLEHCSIVTVGLTTIALDRKCDCDLEKWKLYYYRAELFFMGTSRKKSGVQQCLELWPLYFFNGTDFNGHGIDCKNQLLLRSLCNSKWCGTYLIHSHMYVFSTFMISR